MKESFCSVCMHGGTDAEGGCDTGEYCDDDFDPESDVLTFPRFFFCFHNNIYNLRIYNLQFIESFDFVG